MPLLKLSDPARRQLRQIARATRNARTLRRAQVLLDLDWGDSVGLVAERYQVSRSTVYNWVARSKERGLSEAALSDRRRPGRPPRAKRRPADDHHDGEPGRFG